MRAEKERQDKEKIFDDYWGKLETEFWSYETKRGGRPYSRLDIGLRNFLTAKTGTLVDARRVSEEYRQWITSLPQKYKTVRDELHDLIQHCNVFREYEAALTDLPSTDFRRVVRDCDVSTALPLVQYILLEAGLDETQKKACLSLLESFIVRRAFCGEETKEYNKLFVEIIGSLTGAEPDKIEDTLHQKLSAGGGTTRKWPSDQEVIEKISTREVYKYLKTSVLRLVLERIELSLRGKKTENLSIDKDITIEHVLPVTWGEHWMLQGQAIPANVVSYPSSAKEDFQPIVDAIVQRNTKLQTLGNLTLLNRRANPAAGNLSFERKKTEYANSVLRLNRFFDSTNDWDETSIRERAKILAEQFCAIWPKL
jgi:hypothetical protein